MARIPAFKCPICGAPTAKKNIVTVNITKKVCKDCVEYTTDKQNYIADYYHEDTKTTETLCITDSGKYILVVDEEGEDKAEFFKMSKEQAISWCIELSQNYALENYFPEYGKEEEIED